MKKALFFAFAAITQLHAQTIQTFPKDKFMVGCNCKLYPDVVHMRMVRESGSNVPVSAYVCAANKDSYERATINNITVQDLSANYKSYQSVSPERAAAIFESGFLKQYYDNLLANGMEAEYTTYRGVKAIHYSFMMMETMPTEALFFVKNKRGYLLQVSSRVSLASKFQAVKGAFFFTN
jgi:hypothetical protein